MWVTVRYTSASLPSNRHCLYYGRATSGIRTKLSVQVDEASHQFMLERISHTTDQDALSSELSLWACLYTVLPHNEGLQV